MGIFRFVIVIVIIVPATSASLYIHNAITVIHRVIDNDFLRAHWVSSQMVFQFVLHFKHIDDFTGEAQAREVETKWINLLWMFFFGGGGTDKLLWISKMKHLLPATSLTLIKYKNCILHRCTCTYQVPMCLKYSTR